MHRHGYWKHWNLDSFWLSSRLKSSWVKTMRAHEAADLTSGRPHDTQHKRDKYINYGLYIFILWCYFLTFGFVVTTDEYGADDATRILLLVIFSLATLLTLISLYRTTKTGPGYVNDIEVDEELALHTEGDSSDYCRICCHSRPKRAHHCRECGACVLVMDHHCPYVSTCVGENNRRFFVQFLFYATVSCVLHIAHFWLCLVGMDGDFKVHLVKWIVFGYTTVIVCLVTIALIMLFGCHIWLASMDWTTLEMLQHQRNRSGESCFPFWIPHPFRIGSNISITFGTSNPLLWVLPLSNPAQHQ